MSRHRKKKYLLSETKGYEKYVIYDIDPTSGVPIIYIVFRCPDFLITIDENMGLNWAGKSNFPYPSDFGDVLGIINLADALVDRLFRGNNRLAYKKMLGDVLARLLDDKTSGPARTALNDARTRIIEHGQTKLRIAYMTYAVLSVVVAGLGLLALTIWREPVKAVFGSDDIFRMGTCTLLGGVGAFITTFFRFQNYSGNLVSGLAIHRLDGFLRVFYGLIAGLIMAVAVRANIIAGFAADTNTQSWILYFLALVAGASEVIIPNLIRQAENQVQVKPPPPPPPIPPVRSAAVVPPTGAEVTPGNIPNDSMLPVVRKQAMHDPELVSNVPADAATGVMDFEWPSVS